MDAAIKGEMNNNSTNNLLTWDQIKGSDQSKLLVCYMGTFNMYTIYELVILMCLKVYMHLLFCINERAFL